MNVDTGNYVKIFISSYVARSCTLLLIGVKTILSITVSTPLHQPFPLSIFSDFLRPLWVFPLYLVYMVDSHLPPRASRVCNTSSNITQLSQIPIPSPKRKHTHMWACTQQMWRDVNLLACSTLCIMTWPLQWGGDQGSPSDQQCSIFLVPFCSTAPVNLVPYRYNLPAHFSQHFMCLTKSSALFWSFFLLLYFLRWIGDVLISTFLHFVNYSWNLFQHVQVRSFMNISYMLFRLKWNLASFWFGKTIILIAFLSKTYPDEHSAYIRTFQLKPNVCRVSSFIYRCTIIARTLLPSDARPRKRVDVSKMHGRQSLLRA